MIDNTHPDYYERKEALIKAILDATEDTIKYAQTIEKWHKYLGVVETVLDDATGYEYAFNPRDFVISADTLNELKKAYESLFEDKKLIICIEEHEINN